MSLFNYWKVIIFIMLVATYKSGDYSFTTNMGLLSQAVHIQKVGVSREPLDSHQSAIWSEGVLLPASFDGLALVKPWLQHCSLGIDGLLVHVEECDVLDVGGAPLKHPLGLSDGIVGAMSETLQSTSSLGDASNSIPASLNNVLVTAAVSKHSFELTLPWLVAKYDQEASTL